MPPPIIQVQPSRAGLGELETESVRPAPCSILAYLFASVAYHSSFSAAGYGAARRTGRTAELLGSGTSVLRGEGAVLPVR